MWTSVKKDKHLTFPESHNTEYNLLPTAKEAKSPHILLKYTAVTAKKWRCKVDEGLDLITGNLQSHTALSREAQIRQPSISNSQTS